MIDEIKETSVDAASGGTEVKQNKWGRRIRNLFGRVSKSSASFSDTNPLEDDEGGVLVRGGIDYYFLIIATVLVVFGCIMAFSASSVYASEKFGDATYYFKRHILYIALAVAATTPFVWKAKPSFWRFFSMAAYGATIVLLALVLVVGVAEGEAKRWIYIGPISFQPSEVAKLAVVMMLALFMTKYESKVTSVEKRGGGFVYGVLIPGILLCFVLGLIALEHHISGLLIIACLGALTMFLGGTRLRWIILLGLGVCAAACLLILVSSYAQERVEIWLHIDQVDPLGDAWQTLQGLYAIGSGGFLGTGLGNSIQKYGYVSEPQNDFIFTIICEELGFVGAFVIVALFGLLVWRGFKIASHIPDRFCALVVYGLTFKVALQAVLNIAVVTNSMPNTGISLPFFSSGGSALLLQIFEMGIILSMSRYAHPRKVIVKQEVDNGERA